MLANKLITYELREEKRKKTADKNNSYSALQGSLIHVTAWVLKYERMLCWEKLKIMFPCLDLCLLTINQTNNIPQQQTDLCQRSASDFLHIAIIKQNIFLCPPPNLPSCIVV